MQLEEYEYLLDEKDNFERRNDVRGLRSCLEEIGTTTGTGQMVDGYRIQMTTGTEQLLELKLYRPDESNRYEANDSQTASELTMPPSEVAAGHPKSFHGSNQIELIAGKINLDQVSEKIIALLASEPNASLSVTLEIDADFPNGASGQVKRAVSENAKALGFQSSEWE